MPDCWTRRDWRRCRPPVSWRPWATLTCGSTARARKHGSRPGYPLREEADGTDNEADKGIQ